MKKLLFGLLTTFILVAGNAQTDAGNMFIGGTLNFGTASFFNPDSSGYFKGSTFDFAIAPEFGYFVADNFAVGVSVFFGSATATSYSMYYSLTQKQKVSELGFGGGLFGQYFIELNKDLYLTFKGTLGYYNIVGETSFTTPAFLGLPETTTIISKHSINEISFTIIPSIEYFVNDNLSLSLGFGNLYFSQLWTKNLQLIDPVSFSTTNFGLDLDLSTLRFGMKFYID